MGDRDWAMEFKLHLAAVFAAHMHFGLPLPTQSPDDPWWSEGPHIEKDGRSYYVHAMGCLESELGHAMLEHPDWYLIAGFVRDGTVELRFLDDPLTLGELRTVGDALTPDEMRLAIETTAAEKRAMWGVTGNE